MSESLEKAAASLLWRPETIGRPIEVKTLPLEIGDKDPNPAKRKDNLLAVLKDAHSKGRIFIGDHAASMLQHNRFTVGAPEQITLVKLSVADLGLTRGGTTEEIFAAAKRLGLELVPPETGPRLRIAYKNQPRGEYLAMGMETIPAFEGVPSAFSVYRSNGNRRLLGGHWANPHGRGWGPDDCFIFRKSDLRS